MCQHAKLRTHAGNSIYAGQSLNNRPIFSGSASPSGCEQGGPRLCQQADQDPVRSEQRGQRLDDRDRPLEHRECRSEGLRQKNRMFRLRIRGRRVFPENDRFQPDRLQVLGAS